MLRFPTLPIKSQVTIIICAALLIGGYFVSTSFPFSFFYISESEPPIPLNVSRIAVCLVGGARRFELTGPSIVDRILRVYPNSDLFLHCPLDSNAYKLHLLNEAPRIASVRIFEQQPIPQNATTRRIFGSKPDVQGLLQYLNLVEGCLTLINAHQAEHNFTYNWIIRARVDSYWSDDLGAGSFKVGKYTVPDGSNYKGLNDRFGVGNYRTSVVALSRLSSLSRLKRAGYRWLFSESAYRAQFKTLGIKIARVPVPFCILTDHRFEFPPKSQMAPVVALTNPGPQNGSYCRPCTPVCVGSCGKQGLHYPDRLWKEAEWKRDRMEVCDASGGWEDGWEKMFDEAAGKNLAAVGKHFGSMNISRCIQELEKMRRRSEHWDAPPASEICDKGGLKS